VSPRARRFFGCILPLAFLVAACGTVFMVAYSSQVVVNIDPVPDDSMGPLLNPDMTVLTNNTAFWFEEPYRPSVVTVQGPAGRAYRRLVGLPGETLIMRDNQLTADGRVVVRYGPNTPFPDFGPLTLGAGEYYVLAESAGFEDSRTWGPVRRDDVYGVATFYRTAESGGWQPIFTPVPGSRRRSRG
jgi:signal peptidase I